MALISVIVPVYNVEPYLRRCIDSILNQTFKDFEIVLIDDGSPDNCPRICDEYALLNSNIVVIHKDNGGQGEARNMGIEHVQKQKKSKYITFIDSDDWIHEQYLELLYKAIKSQNNKVCCCDFNRFDNKSIRESYVFKINDICIDVDSAERLWCKKKINIAVPWGKIYDVTLFSGIRFPVGVVYEDMRTIPKILCSLKKISYIDCPLYYYYSREDSTMNSVITPKKTVDSYLCFTEMMNYFNNNHLNNALQNWFRVYFTWLFFDCRKSFKGYRTYKRKLRFFLIKYHKYFSFTEYSTEYSKIYSKQFIKIMCKIESFLR